MNFYSYAPQFGIQYHMEGKEAKAMAETAVKQLVTAGHKCQANPAQLAADIATITWGEVTERAVDTGAGYALRNQLRLAFEAEHPQVTDGRMRNGNDDLVLVKNIHETDLLYHELVLDIAVIWKSLAGKIERFKGYNFRDVQTVLALLFEKHGVKRGGTDGNMQFFTFDRRFKLAIAIQKKIDFGPELRVAEAKLIEAMEELTANTGDTSNAADLKTLVTAAFKLVDGKLRVAEVLRLRSFKIENALWNEAMDIIDAAIIVTSNKKQIRLYERTETGAYVAIPLDIAAL